MSAATGGELRMKLWRGDASGGNFVEYRIPAQEGEVVLDVIHRIQATEAPDLAVRWNCKAGKCGSCSAEINGRPRLMCMTRMSTLPTEQPVTVSPMRTFPVMKDLVTDVSYNYEVAKLIPAFTPGPKPPEGYRMKQVDVERGQEFRKCIECFLCQNVCHVIRDHEDNKEHYAGPRFFVRLAELEMHPLDTLDRRAYIRERMGIGYCNITKCCTEVCPEEIHITDNAIIPLKESVVDSRYDPVAWLGRKVLGRPKPAAPEDVAAYTGAVRAGEPRRLRRVTVEFLSEEWFSSLARRLAAHRPLPGESASALRLGQLVTGSEGETIACWTIVLRGGNAAELKRGSIEDADVVLAQSLAEAAKLANGANTAAELLERGAITIRGDARLLVYAFDRLEASLSDGGTSIST